MSIRKIYEKRDKMEKAYFFPRILAFLFDMIIVTLIISLIGVVIPNNQNYETLHEESQKLQEHYLNGKISAEEFIRQNAYITYDLDHSTVLPYILEIVVTVFYFVIFQFYNRGQTLGKKLMGLRIVGMDDRELTINDYLYRYMLLSSILMDILLVVLVLFMSRDYYFYVIFPLQFIEIVLLLITIFMVLFRKDGRGLHDQIGHTKVVMVK